MPTEEELNAGARAYHDFGLAYDEQGYDTQPYIVKRLYLVRVEAALEAAEKVRAKGREIKLTQGKVAIIDEEDYERLSQFKWHAVLHNQKEGYWRVYKKENGGSISMQSFLMRPLQQDK